MAIRQHQAIVLDSRIESVDQAESTAASIAREIGFNEADQHRISMAVREITVNAIMHGNAYDALKKVTLEFCVDGETLRVSVHDEGNGFDPGEIPDPLAAGNLLRQSGRGIFLARSFMDKVELQPSASGTRVSLTKRLR